MWCREVIFFFFFLSHHLSSQPESFPSLLSLGQQKEVAWLTFGSVPVTISPAIKLRECHLWLLEFLFFNDGLRNEKKKDKKRRAVVIWNDLTIKPLRRRLAKVRHFYFIREEKGCVHAVKTPVYCVHSFFVYVGCLALFVCVCVCVCINFVSVRVGSCPFFWGGGGGECGHIH